MRWQDFYRTHILALTLMGASFPVIIPSHLMAAEWNFWASHSSKKVRAALGAFLHPDDIELVVKVYPHIRSKHIRDLYEKMKDIPGLDIESSLDTHPELSKARRSYLVMLYKLHYNEGT
jgi:hypothetical protein